MTNEVNIKKLLEQDADFKNFAEEAIFAVTMANKASRDIIKSIYGFYSIGMTIKQVSEWLITLNSLSGGEE